MDFTFYRNWMLPWYMLYKSSSILLLLPLIIGLRPLASNKIDWNVGCFSQRVYLTWYGNYLLLSTLKQEWRRVDHNHWQLKTQLGFLHPSYLSYPLTYGIITHSHSHAHSRTWVHARMLVHVCAHTPPSKPWLFVIFLAGNGAVETIVTASCSPKDMGFCTRIDWFHNDNFK